MPLFSVVMPAHNAEATLPTAVESVLRQTEPDLELLIVDDASTDTTPDVIDGFGLMDRRVIGIQRSTSGGPAAARNEALARATGRYVAFLDADDLWYPNKLTIQRAQFREHRAPLVYSAYHRMAPDYRGSAAELGPSNRLVRVPPTVTHTRLTRGNVIGCLTAAFDRDLTGDIVMPDLPGAEDYGLWLQILRVTRGVAAGWQEPLAAYRASAPGSHSSARRRAARAVWQVLRVNERLSVPRAAYGLASGAVSALWKTRI